MSHVLDDAESPRRKLNQELAQMASVLTKVGSNVNEIARLTGKYKETVRYRYHRFFIDRGITLQAVPSYQRLGFKRLILLAKLSPALEANDKPVFNALSELCYLHSFTRVLLGGTYVVHVAVPAGLLQRCADVYRALQQAGLFVDLEILAFDDMRNPPMKPTFFDFVRGRWSFDWDYAKTMELKLPGTSATPRVEKYDKVDLLVLKELEIDANRKLVTMVDNVKVNINALEFHYRDHVMARGLIQGYRLVWQGTDYDFEHDRSISQKETYIELTILLKDATPGEVLELMTLLNKTPFLWSEAHGSTYCAELFLPHHFYSQFLEFLDSFANKVGERLRIFNMDQSRAVRFVISYYLFDSESKEWKLDEDGVLKRLGSLTPTVK